VVCSICGRTARCEISQATGLPWCKACQKRWARCAGCGQVEPIRGGTLAEPLCASCTRPNPSFWRTCPSCGQQRQLSTRSCTRCNLRQRLHALLADGTGEIRAELRRLHDDLAANDRPGAVLEWLNKPATANILREFGTDRRPLSHAALDELPPSKAIEHLRAILVATATLPVRDEQLARLERWITRTVEQRDQPEQRQLLQRYAVWHLLRRLRARAKGEHATYNQIVTIKRHVNAAVALLDGLAALGHSLTTARQSDLETWLTSEHARHRREAGNFVRWAHQHKLTSLHCPATRWSGPTRAIDTEARWQQARWLLHDDTVKPADRVAGLLVLLYAQTPAAVSRLTLERCDITEQVRLRVGREPIVLPDPLSELVRGLAGTRRGHAALADHGNSPWLFPGGQPGRPISAYQLAQRLRNIGIRPGQARTTALFSLAADLPAAILARLLGIHIKVAVE
jgi:hypothetical protein